jgi:spermidine/putrescine transport system substrate-binding protein
MHATEAKGEDKTLLEAVSTSPLVFPSDADYAKLHTYRPFKDATEQKQYEQIFQTITTA